ncbi:MAG: heme exporter protein CcmD [Pseudomonadota bacterium]
MMPDLGKYADSVLWAYGSSLAILALLVGLTLLEGRKVRADMRRAEEDRDA